MITRYHGLGQVQLRLLWEPTADSRLLEGTTQQKWQSEIGRVGRRKMLAGSAVGRGNNMRESLEARVGRIQRVSGKERNT